MNYAETILPEFDREIANTRKVLERVPDDKLDWQEEHALTDGQSVPPVRSLHPWPAFLIRPVDSCKTTSPKRGGVKFNAPFGRSMLAVANAQL